MITFKQFATIDANGVVTPNDDGVKLLKIITFFTQSTPNRTYFFQPIGTTKNGSVCWGIHVTDYTGTYFYTPAQDYLLRTCIDKIIYYAEHEFIGWDVDRPVPLLPPELLNVQQERLTMATSLANKPIGTIDYLVKRINDVFSVDVLNFVI